MGKLLLWHPLLFLILVVIMPFTQYAGLIPPTQIAVPFLVIGTFALLLYLIIKRMVKKADVAVSVLSPLLIFFLNYGILHQYISDLTRETKFRAPVLILAILVMFIIIVVYIVKVLRAHEATIKNVNKIFCVVACGLIIFNVFSITMQSIATAKINGSSGMLGPPRQNQASSLPDIYFVILDEYAAPSQMKNYFQYDVSPFVEYLSQKGFMVTEMATEPLSTGVALSGRLNVEASKRQNVGLSSGSLLDNLLILTNVLNTYDEEIMIHLRNNKVIGYLKGIGYQYIHMGSWFTDTSYNQLADQNINHSFGVKFKNELSTIIARNSALRLLMNRYTGYYIYGIYGSREAVLNVFAVLESMPIITGKPKFIFAHIICPHAAYIFGPNGEKIGFNPGKSKSDKQLYLDQHIYVTKLVKEFVEKKLSASKAAPVIIIQADHGARMDAPQAHRVFSAVYIPNYKGKLWPNGTNSIDTFKFLFNELF